MNSLLLSYFGPNHFSPCRTILHLKHTIVEYNAYPMPVLSFDSLWCLILKLLMEKGDCATSP